LTLNQRGWYKVPVFKEATRALRSSGTTKITTIFSDAGLKIQTEKILSKIFPNIHI